MTSNTPDHETSPNEHASSDAVLDSSMREGDAFDGDTTHGDTTHEDTVHSDTTHDDSMRSDDVAAVAAVDVPAEPVQPSAPADVYDGSTAAAPDSSAPDSSDDLAGEEREPYPIGATDAEPAPATEGPHGEEIVIDYGAHAEHDSDATEPPLTKPSPDEDHHPYPPQVFAEPAGSASGAGVAAVAAGAAGATGAVTTSDRDRDDRASASAADVRGADADRDTDRADAGRTDAEPSTSGARPVYVQAPTPPKKKGNRGFGVLVGVFATLVFAALYFVALLLTPLLTGATVDYADASMTILTSASFFVPVIVFFLAWVLLIVVLTRAPWWGYVLGGLVVALITYVGYLGGALIQNAFAVAPSQVPSFLLGQALTPGAVLAFVIAREVPIWFGVWVGRRGRVVRARNIEAREEYERVLEAGPAARA